MNATEILDREFLEIRAKILEVAAALDRIDRADATNESDSSVTDDARMKLIHDALKLTLDESHDASRAEKMQLLFSRQYDPAWVESFDMTKR